MSAVSKTIVMMIIVAMLAACTAVPHYEYDLGGFKPADQRFEAHACDSLVPGLCDEAPYDTAGDRQVSDVIAAHYPVGTEINRFTSTIQRSGGQCEPWGEGYMCVYIVGLEVIPPAFPATTSLARCERRKFAFTVSGDQVIRRIDTASVRVAHAGRCTGTERFPAIRMG